MYFQSDDSGNRGKGARTKARISMETFGALLDVTMGKVESGKASKVFNKQPKELARLDRCEDSIICFGSAYQWKISGIDFNVTLLHPPLLLQLLGRVSDTCVYKFWDGSKNRVVIIFHSPEGFSVAAEGTLKTAAK